MKFLIVLTVLLLSTQLVFCALLDEKSVQNFVVVENEITSDLFETMQLSDELPIFSMDKSSSPGDVQRFYDLQNIKSEDVEYAKLKARTNVRLRREKMQKLEDERKLEQQHKCCPKRPTIQKVTRFERTIDTPEMITVECTVFSPGYCYYAEAVQPTNPNMLIDVKTMQSSEYEMKTSGPTEISLDINISGLSTDEWRMLEKVKIKARENMPDVYAESPECASKEFPIDDFTGKMKNACGKSYCEKVQCGSCAVM
eukprot:29471_1